MISYRCDVGQGFRLEAAQRAVVGYVNELKVGAQKLKASFQPENVKKKGTNKVVGVMADIHWARSNVSPLFMTFNVSTENWGNIRMLTASAEDDINVEFKFEIYDFDYEKNEYYQSFFTDKKAVKAQIARNEDGSLMISTGSAPSGIVRRPTNFEIWVGLDPQPVKQELAVAYGATGKKAHAWGFVEK